MWEAPCVVQQLGRAYKSRTDGRMCAGLSSETATTCCFTFPVRSSKLFLTSPQSLVCMYLFVCFLSLISPSCSPLFSAPFLSSSSACCASPLPLPDTNYLVIKMLTVNWANYCTVCYTCVKGGRLGEKSTRRIVYTHMYTQGCRHNQSADPHYESFMAFYSSTEQS